MPGPNSHPIRKVPQGTINGKTAVDKASGKWERHLRNIRARAEANANGTAGR